MLSMVIVCTCVGGKGGKRGQWGLSRGTKNGAVDSEHLASNGRGSQLRATILSKRVKDS